MKLERTVDDVGTAAPNVLRRATERHACRPLQCLLVHGDDVVGHGYDLSAGLATT